MLRIVGGVYRGLRIPPVNGVAQGVLRPMTARMRESLFMALEVHGYLRAGAHVVDLFAGSGVIAAEALSRGAVSATCCDTDRAVVAHLRCALPAVLYREREVTIRQQRAESFVRRATHSYDLIFLDPPYAYAHHNQLFATVCASPLFASGSIVVMHYFRGALTAPAASGVRSVWKRDFGGSVVEVWA